MLRERSGAEVGLEEVYEALCNRELCGSYGLDETDPAQGPWMLPTALAHSLDAHLGTVYQRLRELQTRGRACRHAVGDAWRPGRDAAEGLAILSQRTPTVPVASLSRDAQQYLAYGQWYEDRSRPEVPDLEREPNGQARHHDAVVELHRAGYVEYAPALRLTERGRVAEVCWPPED